MDMFCRAHISVLTCLKRGITCPKFNSSVSSENFHKHLAGGSGCALHHIESVLNLYYLFNNHWQPCTEKCFLLMIGYSLLKFNEPCSMIISTYSGVGSSFPFHSYDFGTNTLLNWNIPQSLACGQCVNNSNHTKWIKCQYFLYALFQITTRWEQCCIISSCSSSVYRHVLVVTLI